MGGMPTKAIVEINQTANRFQSSIVIKIGERAIDVKSILGLSITLLGNQQYELEIHGQDDAEAKQAMAEVFQKHDLSVIV
ncbi:HPr family phosphocarrier protein [Paenibacillus sp. NPDC056579]|uniref:HPr family phosphocarrier protein n=1 Tax=unclassified Paenibacillus TaxID=185978 RepID=UPI001EF99670|nr:HPr family phosphocarrier protein [Paenibacillus sp. H1-7]ULL15318.1 HPr family phosphocarrier protein [Paenibacillus sp. H1-7]